MAAPNESCEKIVLKEYVLSGPKGDKGDKGDSGDAVSFPIAASNISVTNDGFANAQEVFDFLLYIPVTINSFSTSPTLFENRDAGHASADFTMGFNWSLNKTIVSQTLVGPAEMTPVALIDTDRSKTVTMTNYNTGETFTLEVNDGTTIVSANINTVFTNKIYFGDAAIPGVTDETFIKSLPSSLQIANTIQTPSSTTAGTYWWFAAPVAYGVPNITDAATGFGIDMDTAIPFTLGNGNQFTNDLAYSEDYNLYRTTNDNLGAITMDVA